MLRCEAYYAALTLPAFVIAYVVTGCIDEERVRELLTTMGNKRLTDVQVDEIFRDIVAKDGQFDYLQFIHAVKNGIIRPASTGKLTQITEGEKTTLHIPANLLETNL